MQIGTLRCTISGNHLGGEIMHILIRNTQMRHQWQSPRVRDHAHPSRSYVAAARAARPTDAPRAPEEGCNQRSSSEVIMRASRAPDEGGNQRCDEGSSVVLSGHQSALCEIDEISPGST